MVAKLVESGCFHTMWLSVCLYSCKLYNDKDNEANSDSQRGCECWAFQAMLNHALDRLRREVRHPAKTTAKRPPPVHEAPIRL